MQELKTGNKKRVSTLSISEEKDDEFLLTALPTDLAIFCVEFLDVRDVSRLLHISATIAKIIARALSLDSRFYIDCENADLFAVWAMHYFSPRRTSMIVIYKPLAPPTLKKLLTHFSYTINLDISTPIKKSHQVMTHISQNLPHLLVLTLMNVDFQPSELLTFSKTYVNFESLVLYPKTAVEVQKFPHMPNLTELGLLNVRVGDTFAFFESPMKRLIDLVLHGSLVTNSQFKSIAENAPNLSDLAVRPRVSSECLMYFAGHDLRRLQIAPSDFGTSLDVPLNEYLKRLADPQLMYPNLEELVFEGCDSMFVENYSKKLLKARPGLCIEQC